MALINAQRVMEMFRAALWTQEEASTMSREELTTASRIGYGVLNIVGFNPDRLDGNRKEIGEMLLNLATEFMESSDAGGMSFLHAVLDRNRNQWGEQITADQLFTMGLAYNWVSFPVPRQVWSALPGGVPYVVVHDAKIKADLEITE